MVIGTGSDVCDWCVCSRSYRLSYTQFKRCTFVYFKFKGPWNGFYKIVVVVLLWSTEIPFHMCRCPSKYIVLCVCVCVHVFVCTYIYIHTYIRWGPISRHALPKVSFDFILLRIQVSNAGCHVACGGERSSFKQLCLVACCQSSWSLSQSHRVMKNY